MELSAEGKEDVDISLKENNIAIGFGTGIWEINGNSITIKFTGQYDTSITLSGIINSTKTQIKGNCIAILAHFQYDGTYIGNQTNSFSIVMNKKQ